MALIYFILILGITVFIHELGHFIFAKMAGIYVYEFSLGMGPKLYSFKRKKDETEYCIRIIPVGGYVKMAGEEIEEDKSIPKEKRLQAKTWWQRFITTVAGAVFNFLLAITFLFLIGIFYGSPETRPILGDVQKGYPAYQNGVQKGDTILSIDGKKVSTWDDVLMKLELTKDGKALSFKIKKISGGVKTIAIAPVKVDGDYKYGFSATTKVNHGFVAATKFALVKFATIVNSMYEVITNLITGKLGISSLAGPIGIYNLVDREAQSGFADLVYLAAFLSINVGFVNLLPFPAFDGGRVLFLIIEKIKGSRVNPRVENIIHSIGFVILLILMFIITIQDIKNLLK